MNKDVDNGILVHLQDGEFIRNIPKSMNVSQSYVSRIKKRKMNDIATNLGGKLPLFIHAKKITYTEAILLGGIEVAM
jgi:hypothetical protein